MTTSPLPAPPAVKPRVCIRPDAISSAGAEAADLAASAGLDLDDWQRFCLDVALGERVDGSWAAFEVGLVVPRQNGKGAVLEARELAGLFLFGEELILHSAHEFKTAAEAFRRVLGLVESNDELRKRVLRVRTSHGEEGIELKSGARLRFVARSTGSGRGFSGDCVILDEAYRLPATAMAALLPTLSARENPQIWYATSTPAEVDENSEQVRKARVRALGESPGRLAWLEWSCPADVDAGSPVEWARANPAVGIRVSEEFIAAERDALPDAGFRVERLGIWPEEGAALWVIPADAWLSAADPGCERTEPVSFALDVNPDRSMAAVGASWRRGDGGCHVSVADHRPGTRWVAGRLVELCEKWAGSRVFVDGRSPAGSLVPELEAAGVPVVTVSSADHARACGLLFDGIVEGGVSHDDDGVLTAAVAGATQRPLGDAWAWNRRNPRVDITPLVAVTLGLWGANQVVPESEPVLPVFAF